MKEPHFLWAMRQEHNLIREFMSDVVTAQEEIVAYAHFKQLKDKIVEHFDSERWALYERLAQLGGLEIERVLASVRREQELTKEFLWLLGTQDIRTERWHKLINELKDAFMHYSQEEEESLFPKIVELLPEQELAAIERDYFRRCQDHQLARAA